MANLLPSTSVPTLDDYAGAGGGLGLEAALMMSPEDVIDEVRLSRLRGRGGAGFPTGAKWASVREGARDTDSTAYLVCNAAEGNPARPRTGR